ncbi:glycosyltransferase family 39 protein [Desulfothermobacter acidiphilus]|uniref:glycosyltransferase family 39 protein n=1 Tax=Desulfothermobacter acidiphilus TaxID=1938353 RepID=UPI003F8A932C
MRRHAGLLLILALALLVRLIFVYQWGNTLTLNSDDVGYVTSTRVWLEKGIFSYVRPGIVLAPPNCISPSAYITPGYPLFLAPFLWLAPERWALLLARYAQVLLSVASVYLAYRLGRRWGKGELSAALVAFYPPFILVSGLLLTETLFTFFLLLFLDRWLEAGASPRQWFWLGVIGGLATLVRPTGVVLVLVGLAFCCFQGRKALKALLCGLLGFCVVMSPWWVRNYCTFHRPILLSTGGGNPLLLGTYVNLENIEHGWNPYWPVGHTPDETSARQQAYALKRLKEGFSQHPRRYLYWYTWGKFKLLWGQFFLWGGEDKFSPVFTRWYHYVILALGGTGLLWLLGRRVPGSGKVLALLAAFTVVHLATCAYCRYALPLLPVLAAAASSWWPKPAGAR